MGRALRGVGRALLLLLFVAFTGIGIVMLVAGNGEDRIPGASASPTVRPSGGRRPAGC